jgi:cytoskeletal protein CcmA (bactofilin family)
MPTDRDPQSPRYSASSPTGSSTIGEDLVIIGNVISTSALHIAGQVHGDVHCASLILDENSVVEGNVVAEDVVIRGRLIGSARGVRVILRYTSHVEGDLLHTHLAMEEGAYFEGTSRRSEDPVRKPTAAEPRHVVRTENDKEESSKSFIRSLNRSERERHFN